MAMLTEIRMRNARKDSLYQAIMYDLVRYGVLPMEDFKELCPTTIIPGEGKPKITVVQEEVLQEEVLQEEVLQEDDYE